MIRAETKIRVRYGETDQMGYAYYGVYAQYYEVGRVEAMRKFGFSYKDVEARGILMPVTEYTIKYKKPAFYDDEVTVVTTIREIPKSTRIVFDYECYNQGGDLLNTGQITLVFIDKARNRPCAAPAWFTAELTKYFD
ncbi:MAG: acyl-CoA thioesterase [Bacteroidia bacterium]